MAALDVLLEVLRAAVFLTEAFVAAAFFVGAMAYLPALLGIVPRARHGGVAPPSRQHGRDGNVTATCDRYIVTIAGPPDRPAHDPHDEVRPNTMTLVVTVSGLAGDQPRLLARTMCRRGDDPTDVVGPRAVTLEELVDLVTKALTGGCCALLARHAE